MPMPYHTALSPDQQTAHGLPYPWPLAIADKVRFSELDPLNHVNNVAYLTWFETARVRYFIQSGITTYTQPATEPRIVIRRGEMDWLQEMRANEDYIVTASTLSYRTTSFTMAQEIWSGATRRAAFECVIVLLTPDGSARLPIPDAIRARFHKVDGVPPA